MRPFGTLPYPNSRFERPRSSWTRRLFFAGQLRFGFLFTWMVVAGLAFGALRALGREYGCFYSTGDRVQLWKDLPDVDAANALMAIYGQDSQRPEVVLARHAAEPDNAEPQFTALLRDPTWGSKARLVENGNFDFALKRLNSRWSFARFESFLQVCQNGAALDPGQRYRLDACRRQAAKGMMRAQPVSDEETRALCSEIEAIMTRPRMLKSDWYSFMKSACDERQILLLGALQTRTDRREQLAVLRQIILEVQLGGLNSRITPAANLLARETLPQVLADLENAQDGLSVLACCKVLVPKLEFPELVARLNAEQRSRLNQFAGVGTGSRPTK